MTSVRKTIGSGIFYTALAKYSNILISILISAILARLLSPKEFGIIAIVMVFISFFMLLTDFGIGPAIVQNKDLDSGDIESIFTFSILLGFIIAAIFYLLAPIISNFYHEEAIKNVGKLLSLTILFYAFNVVPQSLNYKKMLFKQVGLISVIVQIVTGSVAIIFAYKGFSYYALVIKSIFDGLFLLLGSYYLSPVPLRIRIKISSVLKISKFASFQFLFNFINYFSRNADNLLIGKYFSTAILGYYDKAYKLMMLPVSNLTHVITPVLQPVMSEFQDDKKKIYFSYLKIVRILATIGFPLSVFLFFAAPEIIKILFGSQWIDSIPIFKILAITVGIQIVLSSCGAIFQAANRTDLLFYSGILSSIMMVGGITYGVFIGKSLVDVGYGLVFAFSINLIQGFYILIKHALRSSFIQFLKVFLFPSVISMGVFLTLYLTANIINSSLFISLLLKMLIAGTTFSLIFLSLMENRKYMRQILKNTLLNK